MLAPIIKGLLLGLILSISLGPVIFAILKQSITNGRRAGYIFVAGVSTSDIGLLLIANIFTSIFLLVLDHKAFIAMAGAGFLLLLGLYTLFFKKIKIEYDEKGEEKVFRKDYMLHYLRLLIEENKFSKCVEVLSREIHFIREIDQSNLSSANLFILDLMLVYLITHNPQEIENARELTDSSEFRKSREREIFDNFSRSGFFNTNMFVQSCEV